MIPTPAAVAVPLQTDTHGTIRIANTRITLESIIYAYQRGDTPEQIVEGFPPLNLADVFAVIAYYLSQRDEVEGYLQRQERSAAEIRRDIETHHPDMLTLQAKGRVHLHETKRTDE